MSSAGHEDATVEIDERSRFAFGENWRSFLELLDDARIAGAMESLADKLGQSDLSGVRMVDVGSGSGLFSLAARRMGASVVSFDFDPSSVYCTTELRDRYFPDDPEWVVLRGSALDEAFIASLGEFDLAYSWGVLHHTGDMWRALGLVDRLVKPSGRLFISIYNDQGTWSRMWLRIKKRYVAGNPATRKLLVFGSSLWFKKKKVLLLAHPVANARNAIRRESLTAPIARGMDRRHDLVDWVGGYPFEVAKPEEIFDFYRQRGYRLDALKTCGGSLGCNEFVFSRA